jgi:hypothetical protein
MVLTACAQVSATNGRMMNMTQQMTKANEALCDRVIRALGRNTDPCDALNALADALGYELSIIACADCRAQAARSFTEIIPALLAHANTLANEYALEHGAEVPSVHTHH